jgi:hypothetical protein
MAFLQTKAMLAKLLATENLIVNHNSEAHTASFDTKTRVLTMPVFNFDNENVYNMLIGHECSHALITPPDWMDDIPDNVPFDFVNVVEDVRIEKYIQNKFPGLRRDFSLGYDELNKCDFFSIDGKDIADFAFIDRINLHFKLGHRALVPFTSEEMVYVNAIDDADTWDKVLLVSTMLSDYINEQSESVEQETTQQSDGGDDNQQSSASNTTVECDEGSDNSSGDTGENDKELDETTSETQKSFDDKLQNNTNQYGPKIRYIKYESFDHKNRVIPIQCIREDFEAFREQRDALTNAIPLIDAYNQFIRDIKRDVNFMVQQFEMRKSADTHARTQVHKTGVLNTNQLHNYKLTDDIFLRQSVTPDGKSHGLVMYLDWSGSMSDIVLSTVKQIIVLAQFCRKVQIPFDVYTFTSGEKSRSNDQKLPHNSISHDVVRMINVLTSRAKSRQIDTDMKNMWLQACKIKNLYRHTPYSYHLQMGGTPLCNALMYVPDIIKSFKLETKADKVSFVCITDGESSPLGVYETMEYDNGVVHYPQYYYWEQMMIRDGSKVFPISEIAHKQAGSIASWLDGKLPDVTFTNIYLAGRSACISYAKKHDREFNTKKFTKEGGDTITTDLWPVIALVNPKTFGNSQEEIDVEDGANKTQIKNALKKYLKAKQSSKTLLTNLIGQFA